MTLFQVWAKMDRRINLWSIWALSAPSLDLPSFGPAILDGWIVDGSWMDSGQMWYRVSHFGQNLPELFVSSPDLKLWNVTRVDASATEDANECLEMWKFIMPLQD